MSVRFTEVLEPKMYGGGLGTAAGVYSGAVLCSRKASSGRPTVQIMEAGWLMKECGGREARSRPMMPLDIQPQSRTLGPTKF